MVVASSGGALVEAEGAMVASLSSRRLRPLLMGVWMVEMGCFATGVVGTGSVDAAAVVAVEARGVLLCNRNGMGGEEEAGDAL